MAGSNTQPPSMRPLGCSGFQVAPLALGGNVFGWTADKAASFAVLDAFVDAGFNLIDTADIYSFWVPGNRGGESETIIGEWLSHNPGKREHIVLATKVGMAMSKTDKGLSRRWITQAVEDSLRRLKTDRIDLYQSHEDDLTTPLEETLQTFDGLIQAGKVRAIGASQITAERLAASLATSDRLGLARYSTLQPHYNLLERPEFEPALQPLCVKEGLGVINFYGLARGFLTGKYRSESDLSKSQRGAGVKQYLNASGLRVLAALDHIALELRATPAQVALAWNMAQPSVVAPIASTTSVAQLTELMAAARLKLPQEALALLNETSAAAPDA